MSLRSTPVEILTHKVLTPNILYMFITIFLSKIGHLCLGTNESALNSLWAQYFNLAQSATEAIHHFTVCQPWEKKNLITSSNHTTDIAVAKWIIISVIISALRKIQFNYMLLWFSPVANWPITVLKKDNLWLYWCHNGIQYYSNIL